MTILNHYSFAISAVLVLLVLGSWALQRRTPLAVAVLAGAATALIGVNLVLRPGVSTVAAAAEFDRALADGRPTLVEFYSNY